MDFRKSLSTCVLAVAVLTGNFSIRAEDSKPAPEEKKSEVEGAAEESKPAVKADQATPAGVMLMFIRALEAGDADAAIAVSELRDDDDKEMLASVASATMASAELRKAIRAKFGNDALKPEVQLKEIARVMSEYDFTDPDISEDGDNATAKLRNNRGTIGLVKIDDKWKVSIDVCMKDYKGYKAATVSKTYHEEENLAVKSLQKLNDGTFQNVDELQEDLVQMQKEINDRAKQRS